MRVRVRVRVRLTVGGKVRVRVGVAGVLLLLDDRYLPPLVLGHLLREPALGIGVVCLTLHA